MRSLTVWAAAGGWWGSSEGMVQNAKDCMGVGAPCEQLPIARFVACLLLGLFRLQRLDRRLGAQMRRGLGLKRKENAGQAPEGESKR